MWSLWNEINQILNCGWSWRFKSEYYDHRSWVKQPKRLKKNLKKKSCLTGNLCYDRTQRSIHRANQTNWRAGHCVFLIHQIDGGNDMLFFKVLFQPLRLFTRITCFILRGSYSLSYILIVFIVFQRFVTQDIICSISMLSVCLLLY